MRKVQADWVLARPLEEALQRSSLSNGELAKAAKVNYHAVRRMRRDGVINRSANAVALCKFFCIFEATPAEAISERSLVSAIAEAWDGTEGHGRLILDLIKCVGQYKVVPNG